MTRVVQPGRFAGQHLPVNGAVGIMGTGQITGTHQEFIDDLPTGKLEGFFKKACPRFF